jgi:protein-S-isoprenylcysteine O-methyltransferase Ste14
MDQQKNSSDYAENDSWGLVTRNSLRLSNSDAYLTTVMANKSDPKNLDHADVRIPPPLIYVAGFVLGLLLERVFPVFSFPKAPSRIAAVLCVALWAILSVWSIGLFHRARTSFLPIKPTTALVFDGPYRYTRNPMYLGFVCLYLGLALWFGLFWAVILLAAVIAVIQYYVIVREEQYLEQKFGDEYLRYRAAVRRWL